jgi:hypothetical protein
MQVRGRADSRPVTMNVSIPASLFTGSISAEVASNLRSLLRALFADEQVRPFHVTYSRTSSEYVVLPALVGGWAGVCHCSHYAYTHECMYGGERICACKRMSVFILGADV